jgi:hypothetical protein
MSFTDAVAGRSGEKMVNPLLTVRSAPWSVFAVSIICDLLPKSAPVVVLRLLGGSDDEAAGTIRCQTRAPLSRDMRW